MPSFALLSVLVALGALLSFLSYRILRLPTTIGALLDYGTPEHRELLP